MLDTGWEFISPKNITIEAFIAIYFWSREGGGPSTNESNIVTHQENGQPLPQVADTLSILLANVSSQRTPQPGDGLQGDRVPAPQGVDSQGDEGDPLPGTPLLVLFEHPFLLFDFTKYFRSYFINVPCFVCSMQYLYKRYPHCGFHRLWTTVDHCGPQQAAQGSVAAKLSVGQTDGHLQRYHQWLFEGGEVLLNSGALKVLVDEHMHAHHGFNKCYQPCPSIHACFFADTCPGRTIQEIWNGYDLLYIWVSTP